MSESSYLEGVDRIANERSHFRVQWFRKVASIVTLFGLGAALAGLLGSGPISVIHTASESGSIQVEYARYARMDAPTVLILNISTAPAEVHFDDEYLGHFSVEIVTPPPTSTRLNDHSIVYVFEAGKGTGRIRFEMRPHTFGAIAGRVRTSNGESVSLQHFVYP